MNVSHRFARPGGTGSVGTTATRGRGRRAGVAVTALLGLVAASPGAAGAVTASRLAYTGNAFGTSVSVGDLITSGPTARVMIGCTADEGVHKSNTTAGVDVSPIVVSGTVRTTADTSDIGTAKASRTTAETENLSLLNGLIRADLVKAVSTTSHDSTGFHTSAAGSSLVNLRIGLLTVAANTAPNTTIPLVGLGSVVLNEQTSRIAKKRAALEVNMIHVTIDTPNLLNLAVGTEIIVSHAKSDLEGPVARIVDGRAYGTSAKVGDLIRSDPTALVVMPCIGTNGKVKTNEILGIDVPNIVKSGTVKTTAQGTVTDTTAKAETTSTVEAANVLSGLVSATVIKADATASFDGTNASFSDQGSTILGLQVNGHPELGVDIAPNTKVEILGLGTLWLHRVIEHPDSIEVRMIELIVTDPLNLQGLPLGARVQVAVAEASVH